MNRTVYEYVTGCASCPFAQPVWKSNSLLYLYCMHPRTADPDLHTDGIEPRRKSANQEEWKARPHDSHTDAPSAEEAFGYVPVNCPLAREPVTFAADPTMAITCGLCTHLIHKDPCDVPENDVACGCPRSP